MSRDNGMVGWAARFAAIIVFGAKTSLVGWKSQQWVASQIKGSRVEIFEEAEGGNHFMFMENPVKFNRIVRDFMG